MGRNGKFKTRKLPRVNMELLEERESESERALLIVDDDARTCNHLKWLMRFHFSSIHCAQTASEASTVLCDNRITHLICDFNLGEGTESGLELVPKWREQFPSIRYAAVFTGIELRKLPTVKGVDIVLSKTTEPDILRSVFSRSACQ